jgi:hypothetical protein
LLLLRALLEHREVPLPDVFKELMLIGFLNVEEVLKVAHKVGVHLRKGLLQVAEVFLQWGILLRFIEELRQVDLFTARLIQHILTLVSLAQRYETLEPYLKPQPTINALAVFRELLK